MFLHKMKGLIFCSIKSTNGTYQEKGPFKGIHSSTKIRGMSNRIDPLLEKLSSYSLRRSRINSGTTSQRFKVLEVEKLGLTFPFQAHSSYVLNRPDYIYLTKNQEHTVSLKQARKLVECGDQ